MPSTFESLCVEAGLPKKLLFIGGGNMARAIVEGCVKSGFFSKDHVAITTKSEESLKQWKDSNYRQTGTCNIEMLSTLREGCVIILCVKPHLRHTVFEALKTSSTVDISKVGMIISIMAGIPISTLKAELQTCNFHGDIVRLMPNTAAAIESGATLLSHNGVDPHKVKIARRLAEAVGMCFEVPERLMNPCAALGSSSPAWTFMYIESLADGGVLAGVPRDQAMKLAAQAVMGAAQLVLESGEHPGRLKDNVCSPGGTTIAGVRQLEQRGFRSAVIEAVKATSDRADELK